MKKYLRRLWNCGRRCIQEAVNLCNVALRIEDVQPDRRLDRMVLELEKRIGEVEKIRRRIERWASSHGQS